MNKTHDIMRPTRWRTFKLATLMAALALAACWAGLTLFWKWRHGVFLEGYLHGARHAEIYFAQKGYFPSMEWKIKAWHYVNTNSDFPVDVVRR